ncbi:MAG: hypothetical protein ABIE23_05535 [archaeon]
MPGRKSVIKGQKSQRKKSGHAGKRTSRRKPPVQTREQKVQERIRKLVGDVLLTEKPHNLETFQKLAHEKVVKGLKREPVDRDADLLILLLEKETTAVWKPKVHKQK